MITTNDPHSVVSNVTDAGQADSGKNPEAGASIDKSATSCSAARCAKWIAASRGSRNA